MSDILSLNNDADNGENWLQDVGLLPHGQPRGSIVSDSSDDALQQLADQFGLKMSSETKDYLTQYILNEKSSENAWNRSVFAQKNQYQWLVDDLRKAGLNPFLAMSGLGGSSAQSSSGNVSGGLFTQSKSAKMQNSRQTQQNITAVSSALLTAILSILGIAIMVA